MLELTHRTVAVPLGQNEKKQAWYYLIHDNYRHRNTLATVIVYPLTPSHKCAYFNVLKQEWNKIEDHERFSIGFDVSYAGIGSDLISPPSWVQNNVSMMDTGFWLGIDCMEKEELMPSDQDLLTRLGTVYSAFLDQVLA